MINLLITGGAGFIGSNLIPFLLDKYPHCRIINLDKLTYAGNLHNLKDVECHRNYRFVQGDICDRKLLEKMFLDYDIKGVMHLAAETHVDNSIEGPDEFIRTNINGTFELLNAARHYWMSSPHSYKKGYENSRFLHVSTDEVYGELGDTGYFSEDTPYAPNSPYSASKAGADMLVRSYYRTYGFNVITTNCSNNYGPKQHSEKLIPKIISNALSLKNIPIYGDGKNIRDWLYVLDHCKGLDLVFHKGRVGETYNIGCRNERENIYVALKICEILDEVAPVDHSKNGISSYSDLITYVQDRPGHDRRYAIDPTKMEKELVWKVEETFESGLLKTINWYLSGMKIC